MNQFLSQAQDCSSTRDGCPLGVLIDYSGDGTSGMQEVDGFLMLQLCLQFSPRYYKPASVRLRASRCERHAARVTLRASRCDFRVNNPIFDRQPGQANIIFEVQLLEHTITITINRLGT